MARNRSPFRVLSVMLSLAAGLALWTGHAPAQDVGTRDLVIVPVALPQVEPAQGQAEIDWSDGILRVTGRGRPRADADTPGKRKFQARDAAQLMAMRNLAYAVRGAPVTSDATLEEYVRAHGGESRIQAFVRYDRMLEPKEVGDGVIEVTLELLLRGKRDLAEALFGQDPKERIEAPKPVFRPGSAPAIDGLTPKGARGPFTGLVIVADGLKARPVLRPRLFDGKGKVVYGPGVPSVEATMERGLTTYAYSIAGAKAGAKPLVVRAAGINASNAGELILSQADADRVRKEEKPGGFLNRAVVVVVLDRRG